MKDIPAELLSRRQYVIWRMESRKGKPTKVPYYVRPSTLKKPDGSPLRCNTVRASSTNPETWMDYRTALLCAERLNSKYGLDFGVGIVLGDGLCGIDLDKCHDPATGVTEPWAKEIVDRFKDSTFTEYSPSGRGFHIYAWGAKPGASCKKNKVEMYTANRFFTLTGDAVPGTPLIVAPMQSQIEELYHETFPAEVAVERTQLPRGSVSMPDDEVITKILQSRQGGRFGRLWDGDLSVSRGDHSSCDLALCSVLAYWTGGDAAAIDRLFRQSGLYRKKWDRATYRNPTIQRAIAGCSSFYEPTPQTDDLDSVLDGLTIDYTTPVSQENPLGLGGEVAPNYNGRIRSSGTRHLTTTNEGGSSEDDDTGKDGEDSPPKVVEPLEKPEADYFCRRIRVTQQHRDDEADHRIIGIACRSIRCRSCGPVKVERENYHYGTELGKWDQIHVAHVQDEIATRHVRKMTRRGEGHVCIRIPDAEGSSTVLSTDTIVDSMSGITHSAVCSLSESRDLLAESIEAHVLVTDGRRISASVEIRYRDEDYDQRANDSPYVPVYSDGADIIELAMRTVPIDIIHESLREMRVRFDRWEGDIMTRFRARVSPDQYTAWWQVMHRMMLDRSLQRQRRDNPLNRPSRTTSEQDAALEADIASGQYTISN